VTYSDNTKENIEILVLPYPKFEGGGNIAVQRGGGICVAKTTYAREYAASIFLKWFTAPEQNLRFTATTGYMPVTEEAFDDIVAGNLPDIEDDMVKKALMTTAGMNTTHRFYFPPVFDGIDSLQSQFVKQFQSTVSEARDVYLLLRQNGEAIDFDSISLDYLKRFVDVYNEK